jgi:opacity protein-like surface antigen
VNAAVQLDEEVNMSVRQWSTGAALALFLFGAAPSPASADWLLTPFIGANFGGNADFGNFDNLGDETERRLDFGASLGWMGKGIVGFEVDFGYSPNFFANTNDSFDFGDSNVTTLMANVLIGAPIGGQSGPGIRPYGSGGIGLLRTHVDGGEFFNNLDSNDLGINIGAGVVGFFNDNVGIRGDIRYFRSLQDNEPDNEFDIALSNFDFWRATAGVTFRFGN